PSPPPSIAVMVVPRSWRTRIASNCEATPARCASGLALRRAAPCCAPRACASGSRASVEAEEMEVMLMSVDDQLGLQRARAFQALENRHHLPRGDTQRIQRRREPLDGRGVRDDMEASLGLSDARIGV